MYFRHEYEKDTEPTKQFYKGGGGGSERYSLEGDDVRLSKVRPAKHSAAYFYNTRI